MWQEIRSHWRSYLALIAGLCAFVYLYLFFWPNVWMTRYISLALGLFYATWGILAHTKSKRITRRVIGEYVFISMLAVLLLWLITF